MAVTTRWTWNEERSFQKLLGNVSLRLLYKSSVHGDDIAEMQNRCRCQGSTITVIYHSDSIFGIKDETGYINRITRATQHRNSLLADVRAYSPFANLVSEIRILLLGPVGSGKSSFFNSVKSIFQGHLTRQAIVGSDVTSITEQFSPHKPITPKHPTFITSPSLKDRIHCVAFVFDINSMDNLSSKMMVKFKQIQREVINCGVAQVALLTKVKNCNEVLQDNFLKMNKAMISQSQIQNANRRLGIPLSRILVVENYASEREMDLLKDILILSALKQMFQAADDFLEDLHLE
ncbi:interferon-induced protein 44-like isoform 3-T3 [Dama dama]|uniref:interferon-induced protein 44-like isoform X3 n=1 Tax=Dama dama TaxID=30532 RepID=UPI002A35D2B5|nr:interferon-induced protein 44-like isoform X3 [Dama dama]